MDTSYLINLFSKWNISLSDVQLKQFMTYYELLVEWNGFMNLTAITEFEDVCRKHFLDSLSICRAFDEDYLMQDGLKLIDVGTGAGFPAIPIKIMYPHMEISLLDSLNKRVHFLEEVIGKLSLKKMTAYHARAEDFAKLAQHREKYDLCVSRAVANLATLSEYCLPFVREGGYFVSYKAEKLQEEALSAENAISVLGGCFDRQCELTLPDSDIYRNLYLVKKISATPKKYPRKAGLPVKVPL